MSRATRAGHEPREEGVRRRHPESGRSQRNPWGRPAKPFVAGNAANGGQGCPYGGRPPANRQSDDNGGARQAD